MNTIQKILVGATVVLVPLLESCKKDPISCNYVTEVQQESDALSAALTAYSNDPTNTVKCNAFKAAYQNLLNALDNNNGCVPAGQEDEYQLYIDQSQASLDALQC